MIIIEIWKFGCVDDDGWADGQTDRLMGGGKKKGFDGGEITCLRSNIW